ncbi:unnamed protein product [Blepharisma stoltei]|uniref:Dihydroorotate oxidase n=1 Tax=Blepharisma stoltei TaxID=1481888 RepID=A0AAU9JDS7_9CILI|nr:unnamed protein product [Blepharisma stoltei]
MGALYSIFRDTLPGSTAHYLNLKLADWSTPFTPSKDLETEVCGINFPSPIGAAAGLDRNGDFLDPLFRCGFGFVEVGSVTASTERKQGQKTEKIDYQNKKCIQENVDEKRGILWIVQKLRQNAKGPRGANIMPSNETITALPSICDDEFIYCIDEIYPFVDYFTLNLAANRVNKLQLYRKESKYRDLFRRAVRERDMLIGLQVAAKTGLDVEIPYRSRSLIPPIFVKIDNEGFEAKNFVNVCKEEGIDGIILSGTNEKGEGGEILAEQAINKLKEFYQYTKGDIALISSGGIMNGQEALKRLKAGASLVQIYSAVNLEGTQIVGKITQELENALKTEGYQSIKEVIGKAFK